MAQVTIDTTALLQAGIAFRKAERKPLTRMSDEELSALYYTTGDLLNKTNAAYWAAKVQQTADIDVGMGGLEMGLEIHLLALTRDYLEDVRGEIGQTEEQRAAIRRAEYLAQKGVGSNGSV